MFCARLLTLSAFALTFTPAAAHANGAFPASMQLMLPRDRPQDFVLATNFGLLRSRDGGARWYWICEQHIQSFVTMYQLAGPPDDLVYALGFDDLMHSRDLGCVWSPPTGGLVGALHSDAFPDPSNPLRLLTIARTSSEGASLYETIDGGMSFGPPLYTVTASDTIASIEIAASDPQRIYGVALKGNPRRPVVFRSTDGGSRFEDFEVGAELADRRLAILTIDRDDREKIYFRVQGDNRADELAISTDGGHTLEPVLTLDGVMSSFIRRASGLILVGERDRLGGHRSSDGGRTFTAWVSAIHANALSERDGILYGVGENFKDGFAVASSADDGATWTPLFKYEEIAGIDPTCEAAQLDCLIPWQELVNQLGIVGPSGRDGGMVIEPGDPAKCSCDDAAARTPVRGLLAASVVALLLTVRLLRRRH